MLASLKQIVHSHFIAYRITIHVFLYAELNAWRNGTTLEWDRLLFCGGISFALIALMIAIGIGIPARKAMKIDPAEALHNE